MTKRVARPRVSSLLARRNRHGVFLTRLGVQKLTSYVRQTKNRRKYRLLREKEDSATPSREPASRLIVPESEATISSRESTPYLLPSIAPPLPPTPESLPPSPVCRSPPAPSSSELAPTPLFREHDDIVHDLLERCEARYEHLRDRHVQLRRRHAAQLAAAHDTCNRRHEFFYRRLSQAITLLNEITILPDYADKDVQDIIDGKILSTMDYGKIVRWTGKLEIEAEDALGATGAVNLRECVQQLQRRGYGLMPAARTARRAAQA
ncbi:hypothetical protein LTR86_009556 [Recurvomyces mirabilis]|nr:hypothetical protein LTR86_009556 [Recurvomyces mirabilis]